MEYGRTVAQPAVLCAVFTLCNTVDQDDAQKTRRLAVGSGSLQWLRTDDAAEPTTGYNIAGELRGSSPAFHQMASRVTWPSPIQSLTWRLSAPTRCKGRG